MTPNTGKQLTALITGGSRGIGRAIAKMLADDSARKIFINYVQNTQEAEKTKAIAEESGYEAILLKYNLAFPDEIDNMFTKISEHTNKLDIFVHCAAINSFKPVIKITPKQWDLIMNVNARSFLYCAQKCLPVMDKGSIIAISSLGSRRFMPNYGSLSETKSALETLVRDLGVELAPRGIRVNGITAGLVRTESLSSFPESEKLIRTVVEKTPAGRIGTPEDIANAVKFLVSPQAEWIIGQNIVIDGGYSL